MSEYRVLRNLIEHGPQTALTLGEHTGLTHDKLHATLRELVRRGLVGRAKPPQVTLRHAFWATLEPGAVETTEREVVGRPVHRTVGVRPP